MKTEDLRIAGWFQETQLEQIDKQVSDSNQMYIKRVCWETDPMGIEWILEEQTYAQKKSQKKMDVLPARSDIGVQYSHSFWLFVVDQEVCGCCGW